MVVERMGGGAGAGVEGVFIGVGGDLEDRAAVGFGRGEAVNGTGFAFGGLDGGTVEGFCACTWGCALVFFARSLSKILLSGIAAGFPAGGGGDCACACAAADFVFCAGDTAFALFVSVVVSVGATFPDLLAAAFAVFPAFAIASVALSAAVFAALATFPVTVLFTLALFFPSTSFTLVASTIGFVEIGASVFFFSTACTSSSAPLFGRPRFLTTSPAVVAMSKS